MPAWREKNRQLLRRWYFETDQSGALLYCPTGSKRLVGMAYIVPDEATAHRIIRTLEIAQLRLLVGAAAIVLAVILMLWLAPMARGFLKWGFVAAAASFCAILAINLWSFRGACNGLERAPDRSFRERVQAVERGMGSKRKVWFYTAFMAALFALPLFAAYNGYIDGQRIMGMSFALFSLVVFAVPALALGPYTLRMRRLREEHERLEGVVRERTAEIEELNRTLETQVEEQVQDIERLTQLKHFFAAPVADLILSGDAAQLARVHRREISVISIDLRGFTAFSESAEPEEVISVLRTYHAELGILVNRHMATLEHFAGDGAIVFLNDPVELTDHPQRAIRLASELRAAMRPHLEEWRRLGFDLGMGAGVAVGYATIGAIGYEGRWEYAALGNVCNLANRLCSEATDGQVVTTDRVASRLDAATGLEPLGERVLRGFARPVAAFNVAT